MSWREWPARIRSYLGEELWEIEPERRSRLSAIRALQFAIMLVEGFLRDRLLLRASALSYFTVLSVVPLLAVAVSIASAVGVGHADFADWIVGVIAAGAPEAADYIRPLIEDVDFASLGTLGGGVLFVTTVLAIGNVEKSFNDIWGVAAGRSTARRFADYLAVLVVAPLLGGAALSLTATLRSRWAMTSLPALPGLGWLDDFVAGLVPIGLLSLVFLYLYWFLPNTRVRFLSALFGGVVAGTLVSLAQGLYLDSSLGVARANLFFGGFALLPLLFVWIYVFWAIVLLGAEIAFAHQNFEFYREEVRGKPAGPAQREAIALRLALEVARRFRGGGPLADAAELADELQVPVRTLRSVADVLIESGILSLRVDPEGPEALQLGRPADSIEVNDVLGALRGEREEARGDPALSGLVVEVLCDLEGAAAQVSGGRTLAELLGRLGPARSVDPPEGAG